MKLLCDQTLRCSVFCLAIIFSGCAGTMSTGSSTRDEAPEIVDNGYQIMGAKNANQSNMMVEPNKEKPSNLSLEMMLQQLPGVRLSGGRGAYSQFIVTGTSNSFMSDNSPLYVVNGTAIGTDFSVVHSMINPNDVISLSILKGSDASIYGSRGANGVILIRTAQKK
jgi:TonB-dependent SusC/RagA subfamily outer membrane receptor